MIFTQLDFLIARAFEEAAMRGKHVIVIDKKTGLPKAKDSTPKPLRKGKHAKAARQEKAWKAASRKTT
jgi:hypothetical protein